jgi:hypothetical protein
MMIELNYRHPIIKEEMSYKGTDFFTTPLSTALLGMPYTTDDVSSWAMV